jgi:hypothetical protein
MTNHHSNYYSENSLNGKNDSASWSRSISSLNFELHIGDYIRLISRITFQYNYNLLTGHPFNDRRIKAKPHQKQSTFLLSWVERSWNTKQFSSSHALDSTINSQIQEIFSTPKRPDVSWVYPLPVHSIHWEQNAFSPGNSDGAWS